MTIGRETTASRPDVSIVIPTLNAARDLAGCLDSIARQSINPSRLEVVVADGGSHDSTVALAREAGAVVVHNPHRRAEPGVAVGVDAAHGRIVLVMAADNRLCEPSFLVDAVAVFDRPAIGAAVPLVVGSVGDSLANRYIARFSDPFSHFVYGSRSSLQHLARTSAVAHLGAAAVLRATVRSHPLIALAQGCMMRRELLANRDHAWADDVLPLIRVIEQQREIAILRHLHVEHNTVTSLRNLYQKYRFRTRGSLVGNQGLPVRRRYLSRARRARIWLWPAYSATLVLPFAHSIWLAAMRRDRVALYHGVMNAVVLAAFLREAAPACAGRLLRIGSRRASTVGQTIRKDRLSFDDE